MKYIPADKLIAEIEKKREILISEYNELAKYEVWRSANDNKIKIYTINDILSLINSLQQEQPEVDIVTEYDTQFDSDPVYGKLANRNAGIAIARHFYGLRNRALEEAAQHVYESWMGGTMDDVRRDMVELGKVLNARKEE